MKKRTTLLSALFAFAAVCCLFAALFTQSCSQGSQVSRSDQADQAKDILKQAGIRGGLILHINCGNGLLTGALRANSPSMPEEKVVRQQNGNRTKRYHKRCWEEMFI